MMSDPIDIVAGLAHSDRQQAEGATRAVLRTLAERLSKGEAIDLAEQLPPPLAAWLHTTGGPEPFHYDEFLRRVAVREGTDTKTAERHAQAVFRALAQIVDADELDDVAAELPQDFGPLIAEARRRFSRTVDADTFLANVAERAAISEDEARRVAGAVFETLAERISGGEVEDLEALFPLELREPFERGKARSGGRATRMSLDAFLGRVGERLGVTQLEARRAVEAVFTTLRETIPHDEFVDVIAELPYEYASVGARPPRP
jgi:uncharacterized protein (DUF2267 family)